jgi:divalent metal cation (Fe/Co/Zn/Cd) transporter
VAVAGESTIAVAAALAGNGALAVLKGVAALTTGRAAMLAETFHSLADTGNQVLLLLGMRRARRPPDPERPFGDGNTTPHLTLVEPAGPEPRSLDRAA